MANKLEEFRLKVERKAKNSNQLAVLVGVAERVRKITSNNNAPIQELVNVIEADAVLTLKVLRVVNSAAFGFQNRISTIDQAVVLLGFRQMRDLCVGLQVISSLEQDNTESTFDRAALWRHSLGTAVGSKLIQEILTGSSDPDLFVSGLLANVGRIVLDQFFPELFAKARQHAMQENIRLIDAECQVCGATHSMVGFWAANAWGLDESLANCIREHHGPQGNKKAEVVNFAYVMTQVVGFGSPGEERLTCFAPGLLHRLHIDRNILNRFIHDFMDHLADADELYKQMTS
jgi:HD-like signal output (HDOD) protein